MPRIITIATDFGLKDPYVGAMKGAILSINPQATLVDITHSVSPGNILEGALVLRESSGFFPDGTIHLAVVDPGVGGMRKPVLVETDRYVFVGPDNGLLSLAATGGNIKRIVHLTERPFFREEVSSTFHGRDIFGPVAAHLSLGTNPGAFGLELDSIISLEMPSPIEKDGVVTGEVIFVDTFGNLITNIRAEGLPAGVADIEATINGSSVRGLAGSYSAAAPGEPLAIIGSSGHLEIAVNGDSAAARLGCGVGSAVAVAPSRLEKSTR